MTDLRVLARRRPFAAGLLLALALLLVPYRSLLGPGVPSGRDLVSYFYPLKAHLVEAIRAGEVPWVDRFRSGGLPLLAWPGAAAFDPGNVLFLLLPAGFAAKSWMLLRVLSGAAGFGVFLRLAGLPPLSAALGALTWGASGIAASSASFLGFSSAHAALPWFAAALLHVRSARSARAVGLLAVATALLFVAAVPEPLVVAALLAALLLAGRCERASPGERLATAALWAASGALGALLAAPALGAIVVAGLESIRSVPGALLPGFAAQGSLPLARLPELLADGVVADWARTGRVDGVDGYPYFPSLTPGRVAWTLALLGVVAGRAAAVRPFATALLGVFLAVGPATPAFDLLLKAVPFASSVRYPEKYAVLFGFGVAWLAAVGAAVLERAAGARRSAGLFVALAGLLALDRSGITPRLLPMSPATLLSERPPVLAGLPAAARGEPPPRVLSGAAYRAPAGAGSDDPREAGPTMARWAFPFSSGLFGVAGVFERDYDAALPRPQLDWVLFLETSPAGSPAPAALARAAGGIAVVEGAVEPPAPPAPRLRLLENPVPPYRFVTRVVGVGDPRERASRFLSEGAPTDAAFVASAAARPAPGRVLEVSDRPSGLALVVEGAGPGPSYLLVCRPVSATREASVDGREVAVDDANLGFTGLAIPPGRHLVRLRPPGRWLIIASMLAALGLAITVTLLRRRTPAAGARR